MTYRLSSVKRRQFYFIPVVFNDHVERSVGASGEQRGSHGEEGGELKILAFRADAFIRDTVTISRRKRPRSVTRTVKLTCST